MPEPRVASRWARWLAIGRLLPRSVRERVFEPAFADLLRDALESKAAGQNRAPFAVKALGTFAGCLPQALIRLFVVRGKPTRLTRAVGVAVAIGAALRISLEAVYGAGP